MTPLDALIRATIDVDLSARLRRKPERMGYTSPSEVMALVLANDGLAWSLNQLPAEDRFGLRLIVRQWIRGRIAYFMRTMRDEWGVRRYETIRIGRREARWAPVRGMTIGQTRIVGQTKIEQGGDLLREGRLLIIVTEVAMESGLGIDDYMHEDYNTIVGEAARRLVLSQSETAA